jgi:CubicO group peptidase (beta-lactamase class C family)
LEEYIPEAMTVTGTPGLNVALAVQGKPIWERGFGYADLHRREPMRADTVTRAGSMAKLYTATAVMQLVEERLVGLYDPISRYFNDFDVTNPLGEREVTPYDLLTFRSGLARDTCDASLTRPPPLGQHLAHGYASPVLQEYGKTIPRWSTKVGEAYQYSNFGIATLGYLVEVTNRESLSFSAYVHRRIIDPLGMTSTVLPPSMESLPRGDARLHRLSTGYAKLGNLYVEAPLMESAAFPCSGLLTTPADHLRLLMALLDGGRSALSSYLLRRRCA